MAHPAACQDWAATMAAYRLFSNPRVDEGVSLAGHLAATRARVVATKGDQHVARGAAQRDGPSPQPEEVAEDRPVQ